MIDIRPLLLGNLKKKKNTRNYFKTFKFAGHQFTFFL